MKRGALCIAVLIALVGCCGQVGPEQHKRVWVMGDTDNTRFAIQEPNGSLSMMHTCDYAAMYVGLHADIDVRWSDDGDYRCYIVDKIQPLKDSK